MSNPSDTCFKTMKVNNKNRNLFVFFMKKIVNFTQFHA